MTAEVCARLRDWPPEVLEHIQAWAANIPEPPPGVKAAVRRIVASAAEEELGEAL